MVKTIMIKLFRNGKKRIFSPATQCYTYLKYYKMIKEELQKKQTNKRETKKQVCDADN